MYGLPSWCASFVRDIALLRGLVTSVSGGTYLAVLLRQLVSGLEQLGLLVGVSDLEQNDTVDEVGHFGLL